MNARYTDEKIPARGQRSVSDKSGWRLISQEELFKGSTVSSTNSGQVRRKAAGSVRRYMADTKESGLFSELLRMTADYQYTDEGRRKAFLMQARLMESYEEEGSYAGEDRYHAFIGYQEMEADELHRYFAWRTRLRRGDRVTAYSGFILLYVGELINLTGVKDARDAFDLLLRVMQMASERDRGNMSRLTDAIGRREPEARMRTVRYRHENMSEHEPRLEHVISDFIITRLPHEELAHEYCINNIEGESDSVILRYPGESDDAGIYRMIGHISRSRNAKSAFIRDAAEDVMRVTSRVFRRVSLNHEHTSCDGLAGRILGEKITRVWRVFRSIPFDTPVNDGYSFDVSPVTTYFFRDGEWFRTSYSVLRQDEGIRQLKALVRECERVLRRKLHFRNQLTKQLDDPALDRIIEEETDLWLAEKKRRSRAEVHVDLSKLDRIRDQADVTRDRLLEGTQEWMSDEELSRDSMPEGRASESLIDTPESLEAARTPENTEPEALMHISESPASDDFGPKDDIFSDAETALLRMLLDGGSSEEFFSSHRVLPEVFVDAINEKAYEEIGDSIVEDDGSGYVLVEDYIEDVRQMCGIF